MSYEFKKSRHIRASASASAICFSLFVAATPAPAFAQAAQAENYQDEGIVVTARKREELLIDVPQTVQAVSRQEISKAGIENLEDLGRQVTKVTLNTRSDNEIGRASCRERVCQYV